MLQTTVSSFPVILQCFISQAVRVLTLAATTHSKPLNSTPPHNFNNRDCDI
ncbi:hypothetical protein HMPREF1980_00861 [Actinomyces sp. oral taxon 172 str. F0311]|nr:hypothetical protein HMPREF1980_00861 [Actinomyces sp. oral taxon 172 str. F0311]